MFVVHALCGPSFPLCDQFDSLERALLLLAGFPSANNRQSTYMVDNFSVVDCAAIIVHGLEDPRCLEGRSFRSCGYYNRQQALNYEWSDTVSHLDALLRIVLISYLRCALDATNLTQARIFDGHFCARGTWCLKIDTL